jgi:hypothetical protein
MYHICTLSVRSSGCPSFPCYPQNLSEKTEKPANDIERDLLMARFFSYNEFVDKCHTHLQTCIRSASASASASTSTSSAMLKDEREIVDAFVASGWAELDAMVARQPSDDITLRDGTGTGTGRLQCMTEQIADPSSRIEKDKTFNPVDDTLRTSKEIPWTFVPTGILIETVSRRGCCFTQRTASPYTVR